MDHPPLHLPRMLMVGAGGRNSGKTELACSIIRRTADARVVGVKVTTIRERHQCPRGGEGCGVCSSLEGPFSLEEEQGDNPDKDTARLLAAGAQSVLWLIAHNDHLEEAARALLSRLPPDVPVVCESNSLRRVVCPGLFVIVSRGGGRMKPSARAVRELADIVIDSDGEHFSPSPDGLRWDGSAWTR